MSLFVLRRDFTMSAKPATNTAQPEHRDNARVSKPIEAYYLADGLSVPARLEDLSEGGAYLDTPHPLIAGAQVKVVVELAAPGREPRQFEIPAEVAWAESGLGAGIRFLELSDEDRDYLRYFIGTVFFGL